PVPAIGQVFTGVALGGAVTDSYGAARDPVGPEQGGQHSSIQRPGIPAPAVRPRRVLDSLEPFENRRCVEVLFVITPDFACVGEESFSDRPVFGGHRVAHLSARRTSPVGPTSAGCVRDRDEWLPDVSLTILDGELRL